VHNTRYSTRNPLKPTIIIQRPAPPSRSRRGISLIRAREGISNDTASQKNAIWSAGRKGVQSECFFSKAWKKKGIQTEQANLFFYDHFLGVNLHCGSMFGAKTGRGPQGWTSTFLGPYWCVVPFSVPKLGVGMSTDSCTKCVAAHFPGEHGASTI